MRSYFLHGNCFFVDGFRDNVILDFGRSTYYILSKNCSYHNRKINFPESQKDIIKLLLENNVIFKIEQSNEPVLCEYSFHFNEYFDIHSIILEKANKQSISILRKKLFQDLKIEHIFLKFDSHISEEEINDCVSYFREFCFSTMFIYIEYYPNFAKIQTPKYLERIIIKKDPIKVYHLNDNLKNIVTISDDDKKKNNSLFLSKLLFFENHNFNSFFNKKLMISDGYLVIPNIYGNSSIKITKLSSSLRYNNIRSFLNNPTYLKIANCKKVNCIVCRDCNFRYCCIDGRVPQPNSKLNLYDFGEIECRYNPYIAKWSHEEGYQTVAESIADGVVSEEFVYRSADV